MDIVKIWNAFFKSFITHEGYLEVLKGLGNTLLIAFLGLFIGILIGTVIAIVKIVPSKSKTLKIFRKIAEGYVSFFRGTPIVVQLLLTYYVILPAIGLSRLPALSVAIIAFGLNSGAYVSEIMRGGILSVDSGQTEAGRTLGLSYAQTMRYIVLPQAIKNIIPVLGNELIVLIKETSVVSFITVMDLTRAFQSIGDGNYEYVMPYIILALVYLALVLIFTYFLRKIEKRMRQNDRS